MIRIIAQVSLLLYLSGVFVMGMRCHGKISRRPFNGYIASIGAVLELAVIWMAGGFQ